MKTKTIDLVRTCSRCRRTLPLEEFYLIQKSTGKHDAYCKECRRLHNRLRQHPEEIVLPPPPPRTHHLICEEPDRDRRIELIIQAHHIVQASIKRKQQRLLEEEDPD